MPAAYHHIVLRGEDSEDFPKMAGRLVTAAMFFLGLSMSGDFLVVCRVVTGSLPAALLLALLLLILYSPAADLLFFRC
jgi:Family of unknown function (DUF6328)